MPPKAAAGADGIERKQPTAQEAYLFFTIIKNMKGKPEVDWNAVAADNGFKNAETAKVRYGQIKRKLGVDNWAANNSKAKEDDAGGDAGPAIPSTPTPSRGKKAAAGPSTPTAGTGAGVKKRTSASAKRATNGSGRGRKAKVQLKEEEDEEDANMMDHDNSISPKNGNESESPIKIEANSNTNNHLAPEFIDFPAQLDARVLERRAVLVKCGGAWMVTPVMPEIHAQWLARLPAQLQSQFYIQAEYHSQSKNNSGKSDSAGIHQQIMRESFEAAGPVNTQAAVARNGGVRPMSGTNIHIPMDTAIQTGYMPRDAAAGSSGNNENSGNGYQQEHIDLNSIPMHPAYLEQLQREQELRDQQELFGNDGSAFDAWH
ncbi:hypothetical protein MFIFM68171_03267 [Madurella fahalii]|uniref:Myb-like DNA-binding domain-containing protein n=1 Tax=Madurella fahalii TaxID=1157608 RepID=A0ABQ0G5M0_9PEZI